MLNPFQITKPVSPSHALAEDDVLKTKNALSKLGHYKEPESGNTPWPDTPLFEGLKAFQKDHGLKVDGLMKPGGPTEKALRASTGPLGIMPGEWDWMDKTTKPKRSPRRPFDERPPSMPEFPDPFRPLSLADAPKTSPAAAPNNTSNSPRPGTDETQVANLGLLLRALGLGAKVMKRGRVPQQGGNILKRSPRQSDAPAPPLPPFPSTEPEPPTPPSERPDADLKPNREEFPATPPRGPEKRENPAETPEPTIEIYPGADNFAKRIGSIVERNEREDTARQIDELRDIVLDENKGWKHEAGGRDKKTGKQMKEYYAPGPGHGFPLPGRETGDGRKLSGRTDLTIISPDKRHFKHYQTVDVDRNGKPTKRELDNAERIRRNLRNRDGFTHYIILVPKKWQIAK